MHEFGNLYGVRYAPPISVFHTVAIRTTTSLVGGLCACIICTASNYHLPQIPLDWPILAFAITITAHTRTHMAMAMFIAILAIFLLRRKKLRCLLKRYTFHTSGKFIRFAVVRYGND